MFPTDHLRPYSKHERTLNFFAPLPSDFTGTPSGDVVATLLGADVAGGPGLRVAAGAAGGGYTLLGTAINPATTKAALVELEGIAHVGTNAAWACGWVGANNAAEIVRTYTTGQVRAIVAGVTSTTNTQDGTSVPTYNSVMVNGHAGLFVDFVKGEMIGHVNSSYSSRTAPTADGALTFGLRVPSSTDFTVTIKRIRLIVWA